MEDAVNSVLCGTSIKDAAAAYGVSKNALKQVFRLSNKSLRFLPLFFTKVLYYIGSSARTRQGAVRRRKFEDQRWRCCDSGRDRRRRDWPTVWKPFDAERKQRSAARSNACSWTFQQTISWCQDIFAHSMIFHSLDLQGFLLNWFFSCLLSFQPDELKDKVTVNCGSYEGTLQLNKFFCPGLRSECILMADGRWVTPKVFSIIGGKASLKNWKNAVRINNVSLRSLTLALSYDYKTE